MNTPKKWSPSTPVSHRLGLDPVTIRDIEPDDRVLAHELPFLRVEGTLLLQDRVGDPDLADVVQQRDFIAGTPGLSHLAPAMRAEHERWDGNGYPDRLAGQSIPLASRIILACDALNAMTTDRPYRPAMSPERARAELRANAGTQFDPQVIDALLAEIASRHSPIRRPGHMTAPAARNAR